MLQCVDMNTRELRAEQPFRIYQPSNLGDAIRHYRHQAGLTQAELADLTGLERTYLARLEGGKETEQLRRIFRVLRTLNVRMTVGKAQW